MNTTTQPIPDGYKLTEVGIIPSDWEIKSLGQLSDYKNGKSYESYISESGDYYLITLNSLDINGNLKTDHLRVNKYDGSLNKNDLVMILSDVAHGNFLGLTDVITSDRKYVLNQRVGALKNIRSISPYLLSKYINYHQKYFKIAGQGSSQQNLSKDDILNFNVAFPTNKTEQSAISSVFENIEVLIEKIEKLIAKKKAIKQGAMQELLSGKHRLPGFSGKWEVKKLGETVQFSNGKAHEQYIDENGKYIVVNSKFISTEGTVVKYSSQCFSPLYKGEIAMVMSDIPNGGALAKCFFISQNSKYTLNQRICSFKPIDSDSLFIFYKLNRNQYFLDFDSGVGQTNLKRDEVLNCPVELPTKQEQIAIASVLSSINTEIEKLEQKLEKYNEIKQGAMQVLLTGKIRLIKN